MRNEAISDRVAITPAVGACKTALESASENIVSIVVRKTKRRDMVKESLD